MYNNNASRRSLSLLLLIAMLSAAGCGGADAPAPSGDSSAEDTTGPSYLDDLPADLDFGGQTLTWYVRSNPPTVEYDVPEQNGEIIDDAIFLRDQTVCERLNVKFAYFKLPGNYYDRETFAAGLQNSVLAGDQAYDLCAGYSMAMANLASAGTLIDLTGLDHLNFSQPWWSESLLTQSTVNGKLYFASGDISSSMLYMMCATFYNKKILTEFSLEDPAKLALEGKWTIDKMISMSKNVGADLNGDGKRGFEDRYGMAIPNVYNDAFYFGAGLTTTSLNDKGMPVISPDFGSEKTADLLTKLCAALHESPDGMVVPDDHETLFAEGNVLLTNHSLNLAISLRDADFDYGILPIPKWNESQKDYYTVAAFPYSLYGIPKDAKDPDMSAAVMEALAAESSRTVSPAIFEVSMKVKYSSDDLSSQVYDIIKSSLIYDFGRIYCDNLSNITYHKFRYAIIENRPTWASIYAESAPKLEAKLTELTDKFAASEG